MRGRSRAVAASMLAVLAAGAVAGCGATQGKQNTTAGGGPSAGNAPTTRCGMVRTAAGVPVDVEIMGQAACHDAMSVERAYTRALVSGKVRGNGGGAPVTIRGWICQGYATPEVLATGRASACHRNGAQILAVLPSPAPSPTSSR